MLSPMSLPCVALLPPFPGSHSHQPQAFELNFSNDLTPCCCFLSPNNTPSAPCQFVECIKLNRKPFHLVGTSMGGNVAGVYAAQYPEDICSLTLICPAGGQGRGGETERRQAGASAKALGSAGSSIDV